MPAAKAETGPSGRATFAAVLRDAETQINVEAAQAARYSGSCGDGAFEDRSRRQDADMRNRKRALIDALRLALKLPR